MGPAPGRRECRELFEIDGGNSGTGPPSAAADAAAVAGITLTGALRRGSQALLRGRWKGRQEQGGCRQARA